MQQSLRGWGKQQLGPLGTAAGRQGRQLQERGTMLSQVKKQKTSWSIFRACFGEQIFLDITICIFDGTSSRNFH